MWDEFVDPYRKTLDMGNYTMHYIDIGQKEPVVMVHGMMLSAYSPYCRSLSLDMAKSQGFREA
jgi:hypothetical protein